jgi:carbon starvation protein
MLVVVLASAALLSVAYVVYGRLLDRLFRIDPHRPTPAVEQRDGLDFEPIDRGPLMSQHFSAIAAAGPIVGPILAGLAFGWLPALVWILVGAIVVGGVHDYAALVASMRHRAASVAEVVREHMSQRSYLMFLGFIWIALVYIIVAFTDVTAASFVGAPKAEMGGVGGGAIAASSMMYLGLTLLMGLAIRYARMPQGVALAVFLPLVAGAIALGPYVPLDLAAWLGLGDADGRKAWDVLLLAYCLVAGVAPVWLLLQPRGQLGGWFLYAALAAGAIGLMFSGATIEYPAFRGWQAAQPSGAVSPIFPMLFITIACGACSGFHGLVASGTTSKQLRTERDARPVAYGSMLLEAMVAIVSLACVMMFAEGAAELKGAPNQVYAQGISRFLQVLSIPTTFGVAFALMAFTTFVYDTLDVCTRLGRYIIQELTGWRTTAGRVFGTAITAGAPLFFLLRHPSDAEVPVWRLFWDLFGASNQLLAALTLLGVTVWQWRTRRERWVWIVTGVPTVFMYVMSVWALVNLTVPKFRAADGGWQTPTDPVPWVGLVLLGLAATMIVEAVIALAKDDGPRGAKPIGAALAPGR